ncbi:MAG: phosphatidylserine/phosphatidylglycerophosphate/cardiolipin synthase family protein [Bacteriovoracia bacterium]
MLYVRHYGKDLTPYAEAIFKSHRVRLRVQKYDTMAEAPYYSVSRAPHQIRVLDQGLPSLYERLRMIREAKYSIELESFELGRDRSASLILQALVERAKAGVRVRFLLDRSPGTAFPDENQTGSLANAGLSFRFFNPYPGLNPAQLRNHRKLIIVDDRQALLGGRNLSDQYFNIATTKKVYQDRDVWVKGPIVHRIRATFDRIWESPEALLWKNSDRPSSPWWQINRDSEGLRKWVEIGGQREHAAIRTFDVDELIFASDRPGNCYRGRVTAGTLASYIKNAREEIWVENPYVILRGEVAEEIRAAVRDRHVAVNLVTNSRYSFDDEYLVLANIMESELPGLVRSGMTVFGFAGKTWGGNPRSELHAKTMVIDRTTSIIGSANLDPRSLEYNLELLLIVPNAPAVAEALREVTMTRARDSYRLGADGEYDHAGDSPLPRSKSAEFEAGWQNVMTYLFRGFF